MPRSLIGWPIIVTPFRHRAFAAPIAWWPLRWTTIDHRHLLLPNGFIVSSISSGTYVSRRRGTAIGGNGRRGRILRTSRGLGGNPPPQPSHPAFSVGVSAAQGAAESVDRLSGVVARRARDIAAPPPGTKWRIGRVRPRDHRVVAMPRRQGRRLRAGRYVRPLVDLNGSIKAPAVTKHVELILAIAVHILISPANASAS